MDNNEPTKTFQHTDTYCTECMQLFSLSKFFPSVWPVPALQSHSTKANSYVYLHYSSAHAFTTIIFFSLSLSFQASTVAHWYQVEKRCEMDDVAHSLHLRLPPLLQVKDLVEISRASFHLTCSNLKLKANCAASLRTSAKAICTEAKERKLPKGSVRVSCFSKTIHNTLKILRFTGLPQPSSSSLAFCLFSFRLLSNHIWSK